MWIKKGKILEIIHKLCIGAMFILILSFFFIYIFNQKLYMNESLYFTIDELSPIAENNKSLIYLSSSDL